MASEGPRSPASAVNSGTGVAWTNPTNVVSSNNAYAVSSLDDTQTSQNLDVTNFGFASVDGTVDGILVEIEGLVNNIRWDWSAVQLLKAGSPVGTAKTTPELGTSEAYISMGGSADLWGTTWNDTDITASSFGVRLVGTATADGVTASIDHVRITVTYTTPIDLQPTPANINVTAVSPNLTLAGVDIIAPSPATVNVTAISPSLTAAAGPADPLEPFYTPATYTLRARSSQTLAVLSHITVFRRARWSHRIYQLGEFEVELEFTTTLLDWASDEGIFEVVRNGVTEYVGIVDDYSFDDETGIGVVRGVDIRVFLSWRDIWPADGELTDDRSGVASQVIRDYIIANLTTGASSARNINNQFTPSLNIENVSIGSTVTRSERYSNLLTVAMAIAQEADIFLTPTISGTNYQINFDSYASKTATVRLTLPLGTANRMQATTSWREYINAVRTIWNANSDSEMLIDDSDITAQSPYRRERVLSSTVALKATLSLSDVTQWWTDWSEYPETSITSDPGPSGWTRRWDTAAMTVNVRKSSLPTGTTGGAAMRMFERTPSSTSARFALSSDYMGIQNTPVEILTRARFDTLENNSTIAVLHGGGTGELNEDSYQLGLHDGVLDWSIGKLVAGSGSGLHNESSDPLTINTWYWLRLRREGRNISAKVWEDGDPEPSSWSAEVEDNSHDIGWMGVGRWAPGSGTGTGTTWFDWVGFGLRGATAPSTGSDQTVTIGAKTYTFTWDMSNANAVKWEIDAELMAANLVAAINAGDGEGEVYGTGTTANADVTAVQDGSRVIVTSDGSSTVTLSETLDNGSWDIEELGQITDLATAVLDESAERVRTYTVEINQRSVAYRDDVEMGDLVSVRSDRLAVTDTKVVAGVDVSYSQSEGERVQLTLGVPPLTAFDLVSEQRKDIRQLKTRPGSR